MQKTVRRTRPRRIALALLLPVWLAASGCSLLPTEREPVSVVVAPAASSETTHTVRKGSIQQVMTLNALVTSRQSADLFYPVDGRLKTLYVKPGDTVNGGHLLAETFDDDAAYQLAVAKIRLQQAQLAVETAQRQAGNADVVQDAIRQRELDLSMAQLTVQHYQARVDASRLVSPLAGKVIRVNVKPGEVVGAFQTVIAVANPGDLWIEADVSAEQVSKLAVGQKVTLDISTHKDSGTIVGVPDLSKGATVTSARATRLQVMPDAKMDWAQLGMTGQVDIILQAKADVMLLPLAGIRQYGDRTYVLTQNPRREVDVVLGIRGTTDVEIVSGLKEGDVVVGR